MTHSTASAGGFPSMKGGDPPSATVHQLISGEINFSDYAAYGFRYTDWIESKLTNFYELRTNGGTKFLSL